MKIASFCVILAMILLPNSLIAQKGESNISESLLTAEGWATFSENVSRAVVSDNEGVVAGALSQIVRYGEFMEFPQLTVFDVMWIVRNHPDRNMRRLAVVAVSNMNSKWAIDYLDMISRLECEHCIKRTMESAVAHYRRDHKRSRASGLITAVQ